MNKIYLLFSILLLCGAPLAAPALSVLTTNHSARLQKAETNADITGEIIRINRASSESNNPDFVGRIYVEGDGKYDRANINVKTETRIFVLRNGKRQVANFDDLKIGAKIQATFSGPILKSYPVQATADEIIIFAEDNDNRNSSKTNDKIPNRMPKTN